MTFTYSGTNLTRVTDKDGKHSDYTYTGNILTSATDVDGYKLAYTYNTPAAFQPYRVQSITESHNGITGGRLTIEYAHNQTKFTDHNQNVEIVQFNDMGNTVSIQDGEGRAQFAQYALNSGDEVQSNTDSKKAANQLSVSSKLQNTVANMLRYGGFESDNNLNYWTLNREGATRSRSSAAYAYEGNSSLQVTFDTAGTDVYTLGPTFQAQPGKTYTLSAYIKTDGVAVSMGITNTSTWGTSTGSRITANTDWHRVQMTFKNSTDAAISYRPSFRGSELGTFYIDCVQVEEAPTASRYNLIENCDFTYGSTCYTISGFTSTTADSSAPKLDTTVLSVTGSPTAARYASQNVTVSGQKDDVLTLGGWAKGNSAPLTEGTNRTFAMQAIFKYTDGTSSDPISVSFNPDVDDWQYVMTPIIAEKAYYTVTVRMSYDYNVNTAYFDGIQLFKEEFGSSYTYDDDGNVKSVVDVQGQRTDYEYTNNDLTKIIQNGKAKMTYEYYPNTHNVKTATTEEGLTYGFEYDTYGNNTKVSITGSDGTISSSATYTNSGNTLASTTDALGKVTSYGYNADTHVLDWVQYPEDSADTRTEYEYDTMYRLAKAEATTDTNLKLSAEYTYNEKDQLASIQTPTTTYNFDYGNFGVRTGVSVGNRTLATYEYTNDGNNYLKKLAYGNLDSVSYEYDKLGRLTLQTYEDGDTVKYAYDNNGDLAQVYDSGSGITTKYYYDLIGRAMKYTETKSGYSHSVEYAYDTQNNLSAQTEIINGTEHNTTYTYDDDNRVTSKVTDNIGVYYTYDSFGRLTQQVTKNNGTVVLTESYTYNAGSAQIASYSTTKNGSTETISYTYDDNGNILTVSDGTNTTSYVYDSANQLIRENNQAGGYTHTWTYDNAGNILTYSEYHYTTATGEVLETYLYTRVAYSYDAEWGDLFVGRTTTDGNQFYDPISIAYDTIGNPLADGTWTYQWEHGRELLSMTSSTDAWSFTYNADGIRTKRTNGTRIYEYIYNGSQLVQLNVDGNTLFFTYDATGIPVTVTYNGTVYYYVTNLQGDVTSIVDASGSTQVYCTYTAFGTRNLFGGSMASTLGLYNPFWYRGYVYDAETGLYYVSSRYYDPEIGRWINADGELSEVGGDILGYNLFAYCFNNPVNMDDPSGEWPKWLSGALNVVSGVAQMAAGAALGAFTSWTGIGAVAAGFLIVNGAATVAQGTGQIVNHVTKSNTLREDNIVRTGVQEVGRTIGGDTGAKVAGGVYDIAVVAANLYAGKVSLEKSMPKIIESKVFSANNGYGIKLGKNIEMFYRNPNAAGGPGGTIFSYKGPLGKFRIDWDPAHGFHCHPPGH